MAPERTKGVQSARSASAPVDNTQEGSRSNRTNTAACEGGVFGGLPGWLSLCPSLRGSRGRVQSPAALATGEQPQHGFEESAATEL